MSTQQDIVEFMQLAQAVLDRLNGDLIMEPAQRVSKATEKQLKRMIAAVETLKENAAQGKLVSQGCGMSDLGYTVVDQWPQGDPIGRDIIILDNRYNQL